MGLWCHVTPIKCIGKQHEVKLEIFSVWLTYYSALGLLIFPAFIIGSAVLILLSKKTPPYDTLPNLASGIFFSITTGLCAYIVTLFYLALFGQLHKVGILCTGAVLLSLAVVVFWKYGSEPVISMLGGHKDIVREILWLLPFFLFISGYFLYPLSPMMANDELSYHLPYAKFYLNHSGLAVNENLRYPLQTHNFNLLYAMGMAFTGPVITHLIQACTCALTGLGLYGLCQNYTDRLTGLISVLIFFAFYAINRSIDRAYVDFGLVLFLFLALYALLLWQQSGKRSMLTVSAVALGIAMGTKYIGALFTIPLGLLVFIHSRKFGVFIKYALITAVFGLPWYIRSYLISGNPVHPFAGSIFGYYIWSETDLVNQFIELGRHGIKKIFINFLLLPFHMFSEPENFNSDTGKDALIWMAFYLSPVMAPIVGKSFRFFIIISWLYLIYWFFSAQIIRYLMPIMPLVAAVVGVMIVNTLKILYKNLLTSRHLKQTNAFFLESKWIPIVIAVIALTLSISKLRVTSKYLPITKEKREKYLLINNPGYELMKTASENPDLKGKSIYQLGLERSIFFYNGTVKGDWFGPNNYMNFLEQNPSTKEWSLKPAKVVRDMLLKINAAGIIIIKEEYTRFDKDDYATYFSLITENQFGTLYILNTP